MSEWKDVCIREASTGHWYLLQVKVLESGEKVFRNRAIDRAGLVSEILFHGRQSLPDVKDLAILSL